MADFHPVNSVLFNDGAGNEDQFALVTQDNGTTLNLYVIPASGEPSVQNAIPQREKADYGPEGGGLTWHVG